MPVRIPDPVLITGASGFIGRRLALALRAAATDVTALVRPGRNVPQLEAAGVRVVYGDAADTRMVAAAAAGSAVIFDLAAARGKLKLGRRAFRAANVRLAESVCAAARAAGVRRVVFTSTASVSGDPGPAVQTESTRLRPNSAYRSAKKAAEDAYLREAADGLDVVIARLPQLVLGPGAVDWVRIVRAVRDRSIRAIPSGGTMHSADVDDLIDGVCRCATTPGIAGRVYLLAASAPLAVASVLNTVARELGVPFSPRVLPGLPFRLYEALGSVSYRVSGIELPLQYTAGVYASRIALDIGAARRELGYVPRYAMDEAIARTVRWMREAGHV